MSGALLALVLAGALWPVQAPPAGGGGAVGGGGRGAGAYERSLELVRRALEARPDEPALLYVLAEVHFRQGRFTQAIPAYQEVLRRDPSHLDAMMGVAQSHHNLEDYESAAREYAKVIARGSSQQAAQARRFTAEIHFARARYREAVELLRASIERGDRTADIAFLLGKSLDAEARAQRAAGKVPEAEKLEAEAASALEEAGRLDPKHAQCRYVLSGIYRRQGKQDLALREMQAFRSLRQDAPGVEASEVARSEATFEARTALRLSRALFAAKDAAGAQGSVQHALRLDASFTEARAFEAWINFQTGKLDEAARIYEAILEREPGHAEALWNLGKLQLRSGRVEAAAPLFLRAAEGRPAFADGWELLFKLAREHGVYAERAEEFAGRALRARPSAANYASLAMVLYANGKEADCRRVVTEGLRRYPGDPDLTEAQAALEQGGRAKE